MAAVLRILLEQLIKIIVGNLGGVQGWLAKKLLLYGGQAALDAWGKFMDSLKRSKEQKAAEEKKNEVVQNPDSTTQEIGKAYEDMFNSGREKK